MNSSMVLAVLSCLVAVALGCSNCGPPVDPIQPCGQPDCSIPENQQNIALFPHPDPNFFWQCFPTPDGWAPIERQCACGTVFNPFLPVRRCSFWFEEGWQPICGWQNPPVLAPCPPWCPDCNGGGGGPGEDDTTVTPPDDDNGSCTCPPPPPGPCPPCIFWPCVCDLIRDCICPNGNSNNNNRGPFDNRIG